MCSIGHFTNKSVIIWKNKKLYRELKYFEKLKKTLICYPVKLNHCDLQLLTS